MHVLNETNYCPLRHMTNIKIALPSISTYIALAPLASLHPFPAWLTQDCSRRASGYCLAKTATCPGNQWHEAWESTEGLGRISLVTWDVAPALPSQLRSFGIPNSWTGRNHVTSQPSKRSGPPLDHRSCGRPIDVGSRTDDSRGGAR